MNRNRATLSMTAVCCCLFRATCFSLMSRLTIILFLIFFGRLQAQVLKFKGTWVNTEIYNSIRHNTSNMDLSQIMPRCIYVDSANRITIEYQYEQKSKTSLIGQISKKGDGVFFSALGRNFSIVNDSTMLIYNERRKITFQKISDHAVIGNGIQELLKQYFWSGYKKWKVMVFKQGTAIDTVVATIGSGRIYGDGESMIFRRYEFTDADRHDVNGEHLFGIVFFSVKDNLSDSDQVFAVKKSENIVYLYKGNQLFYKLSPIE